jgi:anti-repressor protein
MSSRDIAARTGKLHRNVKRDVKLMFDALKIDVLRFEHVYQDAHNQTRIEYLLDKEMTLTLVSGYSVQLRSAIIKRWQQLEAERAPKLPTHLETAKMLVSALTVNEELTAKVAKDAPKVEFLASRRSVVGW